MQYKEIPEGPGVRKKFNQKQSYLRLLFNRLINWLYSGVRKKYKEHNIEKQYSNINLQTLGLGFLRTA